MWSGQDLNFGFAKGGRRPFAGPGLCNSSIFAG